MRLLFPFRLSVIKKAKGTRDLRMRFAFSSRLRSVLLLCKPKWLFPTFVVIWQSAWRLDFAYIINFCIFCLLFLKKYAII